MVYEATTRDITVKVVPSFLEEDSAPLRDYYFWAYTVDIFNGGKQRVQLLSRHWQITDAAGRMQEVKGSGVIGEQPTLEPGESFRYTSGAPLRTPSGIMLGWYTMEAEDGETFDIEIPAFSLDSPYASRRLN
ncbi:MAG TPA: Co2+/Mg2+ efflux protein ApaG [Hyphomicrobiales bacterium]